MGDYCKRLLSLLMVLFMVISMIPGNIFQVYAAEAETATDTDVVWTTVDGVASGSDSDGVVGLNAYLHEGSAAEYPDSYVHRTGATGCFVFKEKYADALSMNVTWYANNGNNITIDFNGNTITSDNLIRAFDVADNATLTLMNGTIRMPGQSDANGGLIHVSDGSTLKLIDMTLESTNATVTTATGGVIYAEGSSTNKAEVILENSTIIGAPEAGAWSMGGALYLQNTDCYMYSGTITGGHTESYTNENDETVGGFSGNIHIRNGSKFYMYGGEISGGIAARQGGNIGVRNTGEFHMYGGAISGGVAANGGNVGFANSGKFYMYGGTVSNGKVSSTSAGTGGNMYIAGEGAKLYMYDGDIKYTLSSRQANEGGNLYITGATQGLEMYGGTISGGKAKNGGNIYTASSAKVELYDGTITGGTAALLGGNIYLNRSPMNIYSATVENGEAVNTTKASGQGGNIYALGTAALIHMYGGSVTEGTASGHGGNIEIQTNAKLYLHGGSITNGTAANDASTSNGGVFGRSGNVYANNGQFYMYGGTVSGGTSKVGTAAVAYGSSALVEQYGGSISGSFYIGSSGKINLYDGTRTSTSAVTSAQACATHAAVAGTTVAPTCLKQGYTNYSCAACSKSWTGEIVAPTACAGTSTESEPVACLTPAYTKTTCTDCGVVDVTIGTEATGHTKVTVAGTAATCTATGLTNGSKCSVCDQVLSGQIMTAALGHDPVKQEAKTATCIAEGNDAYWDCSRCDVLFTDNGGVAGEEITAIPTTETDATNHESMLEHHEANAVSCFEDGNKEYWSCASCKKNYSDEAGTSILESVKIEAANKHGETTIQGYEPATFDKAGYTGDEVCTVCGTIASEGTEIPQLTAVAQIGDNKYESLQAALDAAAAGTGEVTVEILCDIDLTDVDWNPVTVSAPGYPVVTVNGNNKNITGLNDMLFAGTWAGGSGLIIKDLTIKDSVIVNDENDSKGNVGVGAFIGYPQASATITLSNCHLVNSTVKGGHWTGGLIGIAGGYNGNDGPVFMDLTITGCSVTGSTITGEGSVGGVIGHGSCAAWTNVVIKDTTVTDNTITSTGSSTVKAGVVMGTIGAAGQETTAAGETKTGGAYVAVTESGNTVTSSGTTITTIYGRQGTDTGVLSVTGGSYENYPIEENVSYAAPAAGYMIQQGTDGKYVLEVDPAYGKVAKIGETYYETLDEAFTAAQDGDEVVILSAGAYTLSTSGKDITITGAVDGVVFDNIGARNMGGANVTFNNVTFDYYPNTNYTGLQHSGALVYNNCTINGQVFLYGTSETFKNCTFNQNSADAYNVWTYGAKQVTFEGCTFNCAGKSVLIYSEDGALYNDVSVTDCDFIASAPVEGKAAIEMDSSLTDGISLTVDGETTTTGFGTGNVSGNSLWNNKKGNDTEANNDITVTVAGTVVLKPMTAVAKIGDTKYESLAEALEAAKAETDIVIDLLADATLDITAWQDLAIGGETTETITINGNGNTLTFNKKNSDWDHITTNNGAKLILNNMTITDSGYNNGPWNRYDLSFACPVELNDVTATKAIALKADAKLTNVTVNETGDNYAIWIQPNGQSVEIDGLTVTSAGRGIKIDNQYVDEAQKVTLSVSNATFATNKKAAILVKSPAGADITLANVDISGVAADTVNAVWNDEDAAAYYGLITVTGGTKAQEGEFVAALKDKDGNIIAYYADLAEALNACQSKQTVTLLADVDLNSEPWTPIAEFKGSFDGQGHTIRNLYVDNGTVSNAGLFAKTTGKEIKNLTIENAKVSGRLNVGVLVGHPWTTDYTNITVKGHVEVEGMAYVGGVGGKNAYGDWTDITVEADDTSYVKADSVENGTAYRTYVGGVIGFVGEGGHTFQNITSNIDVIGSTCDVGGIVGIAHYGNNFINVTCSGDVTNNSAEAEDALETGGIAGVWMNSSQAITMTGLTFTGNVSTPNADVELPNGGLIGTGYNSNTTVKMDGDVAVVNGKSYATLAEAVAAAADGDTVYLLTDVALEKTLELSTEGTIVFDGQGYSVTQAAEYEDTWNALLMLGTSGHGDDQTAKHNYTIKNVSFNGIEGWSVIRAQGVTLTVDGCEFTDCKHTQGNALLRLDFTESTIQNSTFSGNESLTVIGQNYNANGASNTAITIDNCVFAENTVNGPGVFVLSSDGGCVISNSTFEKNQVNTTNGATVYLGFGENCKITGNLFKENQVTGNAASNRVAGALFVGFTNEISGNAFVDNTATNASGTAANDVCADTVYALPQYGYDVEIDLSENYFGGMPVDGDDYAVLNKVDGAFTLDSYYTAYAENAENEGVALSGLVNMPSADMTYSAYGFKTSGEGEKYRENFAIDLYNINAQQTLAVELYSNGTLIATTTLRQTDRDDETVEIARPLVNNTKTVNVVVAGRLAGSWDTEWHVAPSVAYIPDTVKVYADGVLVDTFENAFDAEDQAAYAALPGVEKAAAVYHTDGTVTYYGELNAALTAAQEGETVMILAGEYDAFSVNKAITVVGETDAEGNNLVNLNGKLSLTGTGVTVKNLNVNNSSERAVYVSGGDILIEGCNLTGKHGLRYCYANNGDVTLKDCVITGSTYGVHFDAGNGEGNVIIDGCTITGWTSFGSAIESVTITNTEFCDGNHDVLRFYQSATLEGCTFSPATTIDFGKNEVRADLNNCSVSDGSALTDVVYLGDIANMGVQVYEDGELIVVEAKIGDTYYLTLEEAVAAAQDGEIVTVLEDVSVADSLLIESDITLDLGGKTVSAAESLTNKPVIRVLADVTVTGGTVDGTTGINSYAFIVGNSGTAGTLNIADGTYKGVTSAVSITNGTANITSGTFSAAHDGEGTDYGAQYLLNCMDAAYKAGTAVYNITGGTFLGFNPENNAAEGAKTDFVTAEGYGVIYDGSKYTVAETPELPTATITMHTAESLAEAGAPKLTFAMNFLADEATEEQLDYYGNWYADFVLTVNKKATFNAGSDTADGYLAGQYDTYSDEWLAVPFEDVTLEAGQSLKIMEYAAELMGQSGLKFTYEMVYDFVKDFDCGIYFTPEFLAANPDLVVTLQLKMYNNADETVSEGISQLYTFTTPVAVIESEDKAVYFDTMDAALAAAQAGETVTMLTDAVLSAAADKPGVTVDLNGCDLTGDVIATLDINGGTYTTTMYPMAGGEGFLYETTDAVIEMASMNEITVKSGTITLGQSWRTLAGQTLTIAADAAFVIPADTTMEVNCTVIADGTLTVDGEIRLTDPAASVKAAQGLNVTTELEGYLVEYIAGTYVLTELGDRVAQNTATGAFYNDVAVALNEAVSGQTVILLTDVSTDSMLMVMDGITLDLNGNTLQVNNYLMAIFSDSYVIDSSEDNSGLLAISLDKLRMLDTNPMLPIAVDGGYKLVEVELYQHWSSYGDFEFWFDSVDQLLLDQYAAGRTSEDMNISIQIEAVWDGGSQLFDFDESVVSAYIENWDVNSLYLNIKGTENVTGLKYKARVVFGAGTMAEVVIALDDYVDHVYG